MQGIRRTIKRRRLEAKTDYKARLAILKSRKARLVIRKTNRYIIIQIVQSSGAQDRILVNVSSKELLDLGWNKELAGSLKSLAACYLIGMLAGERASNKIDSREEIIADIGLQRNVKRGRIYAVIKGALDNGLNIRCDDKSLPDNKELERNSRTREVLIKLRKELEKGVKKDE